MTVYVKVAASGSYLPSRVVHNSNLDPKLNTSDEWISERTGIRQRHIAEQNQLTSDLAINALKNCDYDISSIDGIIVATSTPDNAFPSTAIKVQAALGLRGLALDVNAACAGFMYALPIAKGFIVNGIATKIAVIGAETMSRIVDWNDRSTCVLFGDGAGVMIVEASSNEGILNSNLDSDPTKYNILKVESGVSVGNLDAKIYMDGKEVFKIAVEAMSNSISDLLNARNIDKDRVDWILTHQANQRILSSVAKKLDFPESKIVSTIADHANTSAASIPLAFDNYVKSGKIKKGQLICLSGIGAGMTWGSTLIRY
jgi:3-oxoacyl-[acyl-carrier-protein] synthase-3